MSESTILVIPCYNEARRLRPEAFLAALDAVPSLRFLLVNDGSTDDTARVLAGLRDSSGGRAAVLDLPRNVGKAEAVRAGLRAAIADGARYAGFWDADLATPLSDAVRFAELLDQRPELAVVMGARVKLLGRRVVRNEARHYVGRVFATLVSMTLRVGVYDTQCGAKLFRAGPVLDAVLGDAFVSRWIFDVEILARFRQLHRRGQAPPLETSVSEYPLSQWEDVRGSKVSVLDIPRAALDLARIAWRYR